MSTIQSYINVAFLFIFGLLMIWLLDIEDPHEFMTSYILLGILLQVFRNERS